MLEGPHDQSSHITRAALFKGIGAGAAVALPAIVLAIVSGGAGHGDYGAARVLFPFTMLMTRLEGSIGTLPITVALLQFPPYGGTLGWSIARKTYGAVILLAILHLAAATACFAGALPTFS